MDSKNKNRSEKQLHEPHSRPGLLSRILEWLARGAEKAERNGKSCTT